jgi:hypothetical protein
MRDQLPSPCVVFKAAALRLIARLNKLSDAPKTMHSRLLSLLLRRFQACLRGSGSSTLLLEAIRKLLRHDPR